MITCFGELLVDMVSKDTGSLTQSSGFLKMFGGAPGNTAVGLAKLKVESSLIACVGSDPFGDFLIESLKTFGVDTTWVLRNKKQKTTLAFVALKPNGERDFIFYPGAHDQFPNRPISLPNETKIFHFGSLTQINSSTKRLTEKLIKDAKSKKVIISYDPNIREFLWKDLDIARQTILQTINLVDILKINKEELEILTSEENIKKAAGKLYKKNLKLLIITLGKKGCYFKTKSHEGVVETVKVKTIDTTGAGDAFNAGVLSQLKDIKNIENLEKDVLERILKKANIIASLTTTKKGAVSGFPEIEDLPFKI